MGHQQPAGGEGGCLQGHCCSCYSVHCPSASSCYGNGPFWASHISAWPCLMVGLLGATVLLGKPVRALTWNARIVYFLMRSSKMASPGQTPVCSCLWGIGELWLGSGLGGTGPVTRCPWSLCLPAPRSTAHSSSTGAAGEGRACGEGRGRPRGLPPEQPGLCRSIWLRSAARVPGSGPPRSALLRKAFLPSVPPARSASRSRPWLLPEEAAPARGAPESRDRCRWTDRRTLC